MGKKESEEGRNPTSFFSLIIILSFIVMCLQCVYNASIEPISEAETIKIFPSIYDPGGNPEDLEIEFIRIYFDNQSVIFRYHYKPKDNMTVELKSPELKFLSAPVSYKQINLEEIYIIDYDSLEIWDGEPLTPKFKLPYKYSKNGDFYITFKVGYVLMQKTTDLSMNFRSSIPICWLEVQKASDFNFISLPKGCKKHTRNSFICMKSEETKDLWDGNNIRNFKMIIQKRTHDWSLILSVLALFIAFLGGWWFRKLFRNF